ncbi:MAG: hypothetical protein J7D61_17120, partial [Marichromatium sp.]|nr:hypothetical protein [Marichromatium sp.]
QAAVDAGTFTSGYEHFVLYGAAEGRASGGSETPSTGGTFSLTAGVDQADTTGSFKNGGLIESDFAFGSADDVVTASAGTLNNTDVLADGSSNDMDTLNATMTGGAVVTTSLTNIENINLNVLTAGSGLSFASVAGTNNVSVTGSANASLTNITSATAPNIELNSYNSTATISLTTLAGTAAAGTAEALTLSLNGTGALAAVDLDSANAGSEVLETLNLESAGGTANTISLTSTGTLNNAIGGIDKHVVTGDTDLTIRAAAGLVNNEEIDASGLEGELTLNADFNGAAGLNATNFTGVSSYVARDSVAGGDGVNLFNIANDSTVTFADDFGAASTITVAGAAAGDSDSVSLVLDNDAATAADVDLTGLTIHNVENISIESTGAPTTGAAGDQQNSTGAISADSVESLTITGDSDFSGSLVVLAAEAGDITVNASAATGDVTFDASTVANTATGTRAVEITGGTGDDVFTSAAAAVATTLAGGDGDDTFIVAAGDVNDNITDFVNGDVISVTAAAANQAAFFNGFDSAVINNAGQATIEAAATVSAAAVAAATAAAGFGTAANEALAFSYQGNQYVFINDAADATVDGTDAIVQVTGLSDSSTFDAGTFLI